MGVAGPAALGHTPEVDPERKPESTSRGAISVSLEGRCRKRRPSAFSQSESKPTRGVISRNREVTLCPIHTTSCVKPDRAAHWRLTGFEASKSRASRQSICQHNADTGVLPKTVKIQVMPDFIGERGGTRTLDPMIKSHSTRVGNVCSDLQRTHRTYIEGNGTRHQVSRQLAQRKHHRGPDLKMLGIA